MPPELQYPFNAVNIFRTRKRLAEEMLPQAHRAVRIYILSGSTVAELADFLEIFLLNLGISSTIKVGDYNTFYEDALFGESIEQFAPDWIYLHTSFRNIRTFPKFSDTHDVIEKTARDEVERVLAVAYALNDRKFKVVMNNFEKPDLRTMGNLSSLHHSGNVRFVRRLNEILESGITDLEGVFLNDLDYLSSTIGLDTWHNQDFWAAFKYAIAPAALPWVASSVAALISAAEGAAKKVLVCDLDNTMWGGVIGDDGVDGLQIGPANAKSETFHTVQSYAQSLSSRGVVLAVNSKNSEAIAKTGFEHEHSVLKVDDFAVFCANWDQKSLNMTQIAEACNLSLNSFVFIDDNPSEISEVHRTHPDVSCISYKISPYEMLKTIDRLGYFETVQLSDDDFKRSEYYKANIARAAVKSPAGSLEDHLKSLEMSTVICVIDEANKERAVQLINKTNQFNVTTVRTDMGELVRRIEDNSSLALCANLDDKFGSNGIVSILLASIDGSTAEIDTWVMSCRVFNRTLEHAIFDYLVKFLLDKGVSTLIAKFLPTAKNGYVEELYDRLGFDMISSTNGEKCYSVSLTGKYEFLNRFIEVKHV